MDLQEKMEILEDNNIVEQALPPTVSPNPEQPILQERSDFTSEIFKIEIKNLAKFGFGVSKLTSLYARFVKQDIMIFSSNSNFCCIEVVVGVDECS